MFDTTVSELRVRAGEGLPELSPRAMELVPAGPATAATAAASNAFSVTERVLPGANLPPESRLPGINLGQTEDDTHGNASNRRGVTSLRHRTMVAFDTLEFPSYPGSAVKPKPFELPRSFLDNEAPMSSHKWELALSLAATARVVRSEQDKAVCGVDHTERTLLDEVESKRTRRPTAIMRQNVEFARLMGMPGTKQKHLNVHDLDEDVPLPQHLSTHRPQRPPSTIAKLQPPAPRPAGEAAKLVAAVVGATPTDIPAKFQPLSKPSAPTPAKPLLNGKPQSNGKVQPQMNRSAASKLQSASSKPPSLSPLSVPARRSDTFTLPPRGAGNGSSLGPLKQLPIASTVPNALSVPPSAITDASIVSVIPAGASLLPGLQRSARQATGTVLRNELGKRKRRPPTWLVEQRFVECHGPEDGAECSSTRRKRSGSIVTVSASLSHGGADSKAGKSHGKKRAVKVCVLGIVPPSVPARARSSSGSGSHLTSLMPPPLAAASSPRLRGQVGQRSGESAQRGSHREKETDSDAFQIYFGDLPSPRIIEVVRPKEVLLPSWRILPASHWRSTDTSTVSVQIPPPVGSAELVATSRQAAPSDVARASALTPLPVPSMASLPGPSLPTAATASDAIQSGVACQVAEGAADAAAAAPASQAVRVPTAATRPATQAVLASPAASPAEQAESIPAAVARLAREPVPATGPQAAPPPLTAAAPPLAAPAPLLAVAEQYASTTLTRASTTSSNSNPAELRASADSSSSDEESDDCTSDEAYERRHTRTLERAIAAARAVARQMALEARMKASHQSTDGPGDSSKCAPTPEEEWRFRPSELAALCAAANMTFPSEVERSCSEPVSSSTAGFFGLGGANRGADTNEATHRGSSGGPAATADAATADMASISSTEGARLRAATTAAVGQAGHATPARSEQIASRGSPSSDFGARAGPRKRDADDARLSAELHSQTSGCQLPCALHLDDAAPSSSGIPPAFAASALASVIPVPDEESLDCAEELLPCSEMSDEGSEMGFCEVSTDRYDEIPSIGATCSVPQADQDATAGLEGAQALRDDAHADSDVLSMLSTLAPT